MPSSIAMKAHSNHLKLLSVVIPARDEEGCIASTVEHLHLELELRGVPHEIIVVDDGSTDRTWDILEEEAARLNERAAHTADGIRHKAGPPARRAYGSERGGGQESGDRGRGRESQILKSGNADTLKKEDGRRHEARGEGREGRGQKPEFGDQMPEDGRSETAAASTSETGHSSPVTRHRILRCVQNPAPHGFGRAIVKGLDAMTGDAVVIMMADESDDCRDVVRYWEKLNEGFDCVFGSRFMKGGGTIDYPPIKLFLNRMANAFVRFMFRHGLNDTTNAFKAYRKEVIEGVRPILSPHFNITVELPLKAVVRGFNFTVIPITWRNRRHGVAKLKIKEMGSRYLFICLYVWLEKYFSRGDYRK